MQKPFTQLGQRHNIIRQFTPQLVHCQYGNRCRGVNCIRVSDVKGTHMATRHRAVVFQYFTVRTF